MKKQIVKAVAMGVAVAGLVGASIPTVYAGSKSATFQVTLTVQADCSINTNPLNFGSTGVLSSNIDQQTNLNVTCSTGTPYAVALDAGTPTGSTVASRLLANAGATGTVKYNLYQDAARTQVWGQTAGTDTVAGTGTGTAQSIMVYGRVPAQNTPAPDTYQSTVTATVTF
ncbi:spore coat protein U-like protein [Paraburkholderia bannensis]|uniref:Spore coat protein U-like protein n=1 Tax=Paraburkholderia bannensis TaxID=765414 RepID=A0A7W9TS60_9BURK|nr:MULTISPECIES: spore coat U domain-containing protein [Paraburkholderia]MBB3255496.1 spore coat protein U-like protein [Paraburkholderia sp. WP4_3_2]MBB6100493.1 spore coat protein U-like protein [Paraburkholderia bannensis]